MLDTLFFDLDGTLSDPVIGITGSIQYALNALDQDAPSRDALEWCIGPPLLESFETLLGDSAKAAAALSLYRERFSRTGLYENSLYPGIEDTLAALTASGRRLYVATSKPTVYATRIIAHFALGQYFDRVFGSELDGTRADKTDLLRYALEETNVDPGAAVMIGDRRHDMIGARNNNMTAVGVLYGYGDRAELIAAGAQHIASTPAALREILL